MARDSTRKRKITKAPLRQSLRIPPGWDVILNSFYEAKAKFKSWDKVSMNYTTDMLSIISAFHGVAIDLDWKPSHMSTGHFYLVAIGRDSKNDPDSWNWEKPVRMLRTRSRRKVVATIEAWLEWYSEHPHVPK